MINEPKTIDEFKQIEINKIGILNVPDTELESILNLFYVFLNTQQGEKIMDYDFGVPFTSLLFNQYSYLNSVNFDNELITFLEEKVKYYFPYFRLLDLETIAERDLLGDQISKLIIKCDWIYKESWTFSSISVVKLNNKMGSTLTNIKEFENDKLTRLSAIERKSIINIINSIEQQIQD